MIELAHLEPETFRRVIALERAHRRLSVTPHVFYELYQGVRSSRAPARELRWIDELGRRFHLLPFDREAAKLAARIIDDLRRTGAPVPEIDVFIAASAIVWGDGEIVTHDRAHFREFRPYGLMVLPG